MTFPEYYKLHSKGARFMSPEILPDDVRKDLREMIEREDRRLGVFVVNTTSPKSEDGLTFMYYMRCWHPRFVYVTIFGYDIPFRLCFWQMKRVNMI